MLFYTAKSYLSDNGRLPPWVSPEYFFAPFELNISNLMDATQYRAKTIGFQPSLSCEPVTPGDAFNLSYSVQNLNVPPSQSSIANPVNVSSTFIVRGANISMPDRSGNGIRCGRQDGGVTSLLVHGNGTNTGEYFQTLDVADQSFSPDSSRLTCLNTILFGWFRANTSTSSEWNIRGESTRSIEAYNYTMLACSQQLAAYSVSVTVDPTGLVIGYDCLSTANQAFALPDSMERLDNLTTQFTSLVIRGPGDSYNPIFGMTFHNDGNANDWISYLMALHTISSDFLDPHLTAPDPTAMATRVKTTYQTLVAIMLVQHYATSNLLAPDGSPVQGHVSYQVKRVAGSTPMFIIAAVVLSLNLVTAIAYFIYTGRNRLPWSPSSIAATIAYFADSDALADVQRTATMSTRQRDEFPQTRGSLYGLGKVADEHGRERWVIDHADKIFKRPDGKLDARPLNHADGPRETEPGRNELYGFF